MTHKLTKQNTLLAQSAETYQCCTQTTRPQMFQNLKINELRLYQELKNFATFQEPSGFGPQKTFKLFKLAIANTI